jgi:hypothetical protein
MEKSNDGEWGKDVMPEHQPLWICSLEPQ